MTAKKKFFESEELGELHFASKKFAAYLQNICKEQELYSLDDTTFDLGLNMGVRSALMLLNYYLINEDGKIDRKAFLAFMKKIEENENPFV